jgi:aminopeptidase N
MSDLATALQTALANKIKQEKQMQTNTDELKTTINSWAKDDPRDDARSRLPHAFKPTNNVSRETFNAVRDNPRLQHKDIARMLANRGFNQASIGSLLTQMLNCGMVTRDDNGRYTALQQEYTPIKANTKTKAKKKIAVPATKKPNAGIAALETQDTVAKKVVVIRKQEAPAPAFDPEQLLSTLSFSQVMALYKRIKTMVGEA